MKKLISLFTTLCIVFAVLGTFTVFAQDSADLEISTLAELEAFRDDVNNGNTYEGKTVKLTADIDLSSVCGENVNGEKVSWTPIGDIDGEPDFCNGDKTHQFDGTFDGRGHKITNLYINAYIEDEDAYEGHAETVGLFGFVQGTIRNLAVEGYVAAFGYASGIVGYAEESNIEKCSFTGTINSVAHTGGIVGTIRGGSISDCFNAADILGYGGIGGITGVLDGADMERCYNVGNIIPIDEDAYYMGSIATIGWNETVTDCYYLEGTSDKGLYIESYGEEEGTDPTTALTTEQFADKTNFTNWDFDTVWEMDATLKRPVLRSNTEEPPIEHTHTLVYHKAVAATCTENGTGEYWKCEGTDACNKMFSDVNGTTEIAEIPVIPATGHSYGAWSISEEPTNYTPGTAVRICENDSEHKDYAFLPVLTDTTVWTEDLRIEPTETENGLVTYTSQYGDVAIIIPALNPQYDYSIKYENSTATITVPQDGTYAVIFADYDTNNRLLSVYAKDIYLSKGENLLTPTEFNAKGSVKAMLWDSLTGMKPLCAADGQ